MHWLTLLSSRLDWLRRQSDLCAIRPSAGAFVLMGALLAESNTVDLPAEAGGGGEGGEHVDVDMDVRTCRSARSAEPDQQRAAQC